MDCPRCGASAVTTPECPACGVLVAKARSARPRPERLAADGPHPAAWRSLLLPGLGLALLVAAAVVHLREPAAVTPAAEEPEARRAATPEPAAPAASLDPGLSAAPPEAPPPSFAVETATASDPATEADLAAAARLVERLRAQARVSTDDVRIAEGLYARHPSGARELLEAVLLAAAAADQSARRFDSASAHVERAQGIAPESPRPRRALLALRLSAGDWAAAEQAGRAFLALAPGDAEATRGVAYALLRQDRVREATELLTSFLNAREDPEARALLNKMLRDQAPEQSLDEARLAHFHVRYDGDAHEEVGREVLRVLDRHYATLARNFDHQPSAPIPVILLSRESYYDATGAPAWSGGQYDSFDGRVRIPIGGLSAALAPELDGTLVHELTHSFVADLSRGLAPRELHEGLAQYMEGRRVSQIDESRLRALADGRLRGVSGFYFFALWFVEDLLGQRGQGGINDLLRAMSSTGSRDEGFRSVYGRDFAGLQRQAQERLRQRHGS
jgi:tetratricopeptide (TPR) repeat protein